MKIQISILVLMKKMLFAAVLVFLVVGSSITAVAQGDPKELENNCNAGGPDACFKLGTMFARGKDVPKDNARASSLFQKSCDGGFSEGCTKLGTNYEFGHGVQEDPTRAFTLWEKACAGGSTSGCGKLGRPYEQGIGVPHDYTLASLHYGQACSLGEGYGCWSVARIHSPQKGALKDATRWAVFMEKTCDSGYMADSCLKIGLAFDLGMWVSKDSDHATALFKKGCFHGNKEACNLIER
jgi:TPR repeat protein